MGSNVCKEDNRTGDFTKSRRYPYTFQQDGEEILNIGGPKAESQKYAPISQYNEREQCSKLKTDYAVQAILSSTSIAKYGQQVDHGEYDPKYYKFKISGNVYHGQWKNKVPHGVGIMYYQKGNAYIGSFIEGVPFGKGKLIMASGAYYEGDIKYGKANGKGQYNHQNYIYYGEFRDDMKHGEGEERQQSYTFKGLFQNNQKIKGVYKYQNCIYNGEFQNDQFQGKGTLTAEDGSQYNGTFKNGRFHGYGEYKWSDGSVYRGYYINGEKDGDGQLFNSKNSSISKGVWNKGVLNGVGQYIDYRKKVTKCIWDNGRLTGVKTD